MKAGPLLLDYKCRHQVTKRKVYGSEDHDYRVAERTAYTVNGSIKSKVSVKQWIGGKGRPWLPGEVEWWSSAVHGLAEKLQVQKIEFGRPAVADVFRLPLIKNIPVFDERSRRWVHAPVRRIVPVTEGRMMVSLRTIDALGTKSIADLNVVKIINRNGARPEGMCGLQCAWMLLHLLGKSPKWENLQHDFPTADGRHSMADLQRAAKAYGVELSGYQVPFSEMGRLPTPCIAYSSFGNQGHFYVIKEIQSDKIVVFWPPDMVEVVPINRLTAQGWSNGYILTPTINGEDN